MRATESFGGRFPTFRFALQNCLLRSSRGTAAALAEMQVEGKGKSRRQVQMAMVGHAVKALQLVAKNGAQGKQVGHFLRMFFGLHEMFQPGKHEKPNGAGPRPAKFVYADPPVETPAEPTSRPTPPSSGTLLDANGQEYVE